MREDAYINEGEATRLAELTLIFIPTYSFERYPSNIYLLNIYMHVTLLHVMYVPLYRRFKENEYA